MTHDHRNHEDAEKLYELIKDIRIAMMTTVNADGTLHGRPMYNQVADEAGDLWFFTKDSSPKTTEISRDGHVHLGYVDLDNQRYISVSGRAELVHDKAKAQELWSEGMRIWFPKGADDPSIALVRIHPEKGEYWEGPSNTVYYLYGYAKARLTGEPPHELGEDKKVNLKG